MENNIIIPLLLTTLAGLSTGIGSIIALFIKEFKHSYLSFMLGFSAGVMIYISFVELLAHSISGVGFVWGNLAFFSGIILFYLIERFIPHWYLEENEKKYDPMNMNGHNHPRGRHGFRGGRGTLPERGKLMNVGVMTAVGISIHNFPEGVGVLFTSINDVSVGISLAVAIALHNIPEGIAVSMPIYYATKSRRKAFLYSLFSGLSEPIGAIIGYLILGPFLTEAMLMITLGVVAGIMVIISFDELLPVSYIPGEEHIAISGILVGMAVMMLSLAAR